MVSSTSSSEVLEDASRLVVAMQAFWVGSLGVKSPRASRWGRARTPAAQSLGSFPGWGQEVVQVEEGLLPCAGSELRHAASTAMGSPVESSDGGLNRPAVLQPQPWSLRTQAPCYAADLGPQASSLRIRQCFAYTLVTLPGSLDPLDSLASLHP